MTSTIQRSFAGGEISPSLYARADQVKYATGLRTCRNFMVMRHGGATNRPGTYYVAEVKDSTKAVRLIKFVFNDSQTYVLEFGDQYMRVIKDGVQLESGGSPYEISTPYLEADLSDLQYVQSGDIVTIVHPGYEPRELQRTGDTSWTLTVIDFSPSLGEPGTPTITPKGTTGSTTYKYQCTAVAEETYEESLASPTGTTTTGNATLDKTNYNEVVVSPVSLPTNTLEVNVYREENGVFGFIGIMREDGGAWVFNDIGYETDLSDTPPLARNPFNAAGKYPSTATYFQQRLVFANSDNDPEKVWTSRTGDFNNFTISNPLQADDAVTFTIVDRQVNEVRHLFEIGRLVALTSGGEWTIEGDAAGILQPTAINLKQQGYNGANKLKPIIIGNNALYVQARGSLVRDLRYQFESDGYAGQDLTVFASHLFDGYTLLDWDFQQIPNSIVWAVRSDGTLLGLTYLREHNVWGWHRHDTDGEYENVCVVPEGDEDYLYCVVKRTVNGTTKRYIERLVSRQIRDFDADAFFVDSGLTYDGRNTNDSHTMTLSGGTNWTYGEEFTLTSSTSYFVAGDVGNAIVLQLLDSEGEVTDELTCEILTYTSGTEVEVLSDKDVASGFRNTAISDWNKAVDTVSGLDHLEGKILSVLADGNVLFNGDPDDDIASNFTVSSGSITLDRPYSIIHAGLPYVSDLETLDLENINGETLADKKKLINKVTLFVEESRGIFVGPDANHLREAKQRSTEDYGQPVNPLTGTIEVTCDSSWNKHGRTFVRQRDPLPLAVLAIVPNGSVGG